MAMQITANTGRDQQVVSYTVTGAGDRDGTYWILSLPPWLYDHLNGKSNGTSSDLGPPPEVPNEMPPPPPLAQDHTTLANTTLPTYDTGANGPITVNTEALQAFSKTLDSLAEPLLALKNEVDKVSIHPGAFYQAFHLKNAVHGDAALQNNTSKVITQTLDAFALIKRAITQLAAEYDTVEELNSAGADDLNKHIGGAKNLINKMSGS